MSKYFLDKMSKIYLVLKVFAIGDFDCKPYAFVSLKGFQETLHKYISAIVSIEQQFKTLGIYTISFWNFRPKWICLTNDLIKKMGINKNSPAQIIEINNDLKDFNYKIVKPMTIECSVNGFRWVGYCDDDNAWFFTPKLRYEEFQKLIIEYDLKSDKNGN